ncbi:MAG: polysaccharide biosynthesis/export family protein [Candidatus Azobacteroides sp.]|nr:polysaccharide biosynthesis/export family protein [Candidatus Azobacteroides sp.]
MKFNIGLLLICLLAVMVGASCTSSRKVTYLQYDSNLGEADFYTQSRDNVIRYQPDDVLGIVVNVVGQPAVAYDFNLPLQPAATTDNSSDYVDQGVGRQTYMVNKEGQIDFPVLGAVKVSGLTQAELERYLKMALRAYLKVEPVVTVRMMNFRITILGEVQRPGQYSVSKDHVSVLEALALAGDMTIYGKRDDVRLIREMPNGEVKIVSMDISKAQIVSSPYFYLHQNDQLYVVPNSAKAKSADIGSQTSLWFSIASVAFTVFNIVVSLTR